MSAELDTQKERASRWFGELRDAICAAFECVVTTATFQNVRPIAAVELVISVKAFQIILTGSTVNCVGSSATRRRRDRRRRIF